MVSTLSIKKFKSLKIAILKRSEHLLLNSMEIQNNFLECFLKLTFILQSFPKFSLLFQKTVSILSLINLQKSAKSDFQMLRPFIFDLNVASKPFSKMLPMTNFRFKYFSVLCLSFSENNFNFVTQKNVLYFGKYHFLNLENICFLPQGSYQIHFVRSFLCTTLDLNKFQ